MMGKLIDSTGCRYGRLTILRRDGYISGRVSWLCLCDCGNEISVTSNSLRTGKTRSCGCLRQETAARNASHGGNARAKQLYKHGESGSRLYNVWKSMRERCNNPNDKFFSDYGGRGIQVCAEWDDFSTFKLWAEKTATGEMRNSESAH